MTRIGCEEAAMNSKTAGNQGPRRAGALAVVAAVAVLATACGGRFDPSPAGSAPGGAATFTFAQELVLAQCMRGHGVPDFPDPNAAGGFSDLNASTLDSSRVQAAYGACRHLLPGGGPSIAQLQQEMQQEQQEQRKELPALLKFSQCMRGHGVPDFPDPPSSGQSSPAPPNGRGMSPSAPRFQAAVGACQHVLPAGANLHVSTHGSAHGS
jgi:hypothetical protein